MRIQLFATCLIDSLFPELGQAVVQVLADAGVEVDFPAEQTCCGQPALNVGLPAEARALAIQTIKVLSDDAPVVVPSGSCTEMLRHRYPELLADDPTWSGPARRLAERTYEFSQFLVDQLLVADFGAEIPAMVAYHPSCHSLRGLGVDRQPMELLNTAAGAPVQRLEPECCGFGGVFSVDHAPISAEMLKRTLRRIEDSAAEVVVGCDASCLMHIEGGLRRAGSSVRCAHLAQVLAGSPPGLR